MRHTFRIANAKPNIDLQSRPLAPDFNTPDCQKNTYSVEKLRCSSWRWPKPANCASSSRFSSIMLYISGGVLRIFLRNTFFLLLFLLTRGQPATYKYITKKNRVGSGSGKMSGEKEILIRIKPPSFVQLHQACVDGSPRSPRFFTPAAYITHCILRGGS